MTGLKARSLVAAFAVSATSAVAFLAPGTASAACTGANIKGNGSSLQAAAQQKYWSVPFNAKCPVTNEQVEYESTSSGKGLASWWVGHNEEKFKGFGPTNAFVGTDQPPNEGQEKEILEKASGSTPIVLSIPVLQAAVALPIHLPTGCTATSDKGKIHRLTLSDADLQAIFARTITKWNELPAYSNNTLVGASCDKDAEITRIVRFEGSGTTAITKKFLFEIDKNPVSEGETWNELAEKNENLTWPDESAGLIRAEKGTGIASKVAETAGSIGYANLNEVRANPAYTSAGSGGEGTGIFWAELQSDGKKFQDPSSVGGEKGEPASANCKDESYISLNKTGKQGKFPPESAEDVWNEVTANKVEKASYPLCGFTYDLSLTDFENFSATSSAEVETVKNYLTYVLSAEGQGALSGHDFLALPESKKYGKVLSIARAGVGKIAFKG